MLVIARFCKTILLIKVSLSDMVARLNTGHLVIFDFQVNRSSAPNIAGGILILKIILLSEIPIKWVLKIFLSIFFMFC